MHAETLAYMLHQLPSDKKIRQPQVRYRWSAAAGSPGMIEIPGGCVTLGLSRDDPATFGWDNEFEAHPVSVPAFAIDRYKVTNGEYLRFVAAGGYQERSLWSAEDWDWKRAGHLASGFLERRPAMAGCCAACSKKSRCRSTGRST